MAKEPYGAEALNPEVAKDYELVNWVGGHIQSFGKWTANFQGGVIDLRKLTPAQAEGLVAKGFPKLRKKSKTTTAAATTSSGKDDKK